LQTDKHLHRNFGNSPNFVLRRLGIKLRAVTEKYKGKGINSGLTFDGTHGSMFAACYFN